MKTIVILGFMTAFSLGEDTPTLHHFQEPHMGCLFSITVSAKEKSKAEEAAKAAFRRIGELDLKFSDYTADSELSMLSASAGSGKPVALSGDLRKILQQSQEFWKWSDGTFDITLGACCKLWRTSRKTTSLPMESELKTALNTIGFNELDLDFTTGQATPKKSGLMLDLGGIAKGFALDEATTLLKTKYRVHDFLIDAGGQVAAIGHPPNRTTWNVAVEKLPEEPESAPTLVARISDLHLATSGDLHQSVTIGGKHYAHIIDPKTGLGLTYTVQASVIAQNGAAADAIATALCILPEDTARAKLTEFPGVEVRVLRKSEKGTLTSWETKGWAKYTSKPQP